MGTLEKFENFYNIDTFQVDGKKMFELQSIFVKNFSHNSFIKQILSYLLEEDQEKRLYPSQLKKQLGLISKQSNVN